MAGNELPTEYDEIVLGTGLQESILAAALARIGHRVLHLDRNDYYSGDWASFNLNGLLDWIEKNTNDEAEEDAPQPNESDSLLQEGERLVGLPHNPKTAFNIDVKCYVQEGDLNAIQERPIVFPPPIPEPAPVENNDNLPEEQQAEGQGPSNASVESGGSAEDQAAGEPGTADGNETGANASAAQGSQSGESEQTPSTENETKSDGKQSQVPNEKDSNEDQAASVSVTEGQAQQPPNESQGSTDQGSSDNQNQERSEVSQEDQVAEASESAAGGDDAGTSSAVAAEPPARRVWTWADIKSKWRKFNIDLAPKLLFCRGSMVELLVSSRISRYAEFKAVSRILTHINGRLEQVPCSRADVFSSKYVNMLEKRMLMRIIEFCMNHQNLQDEYEAFKDRPFVEFLQSRKLTPTLQHFVIHSIAMVSATTPTEQALQSMQYFLRSLGRYGNTAFLWTLYGSGELPQCFCRMCAVFAGIYMLRNLPQGLIMDSENNCKGIIDPEGRRLTCNHLVMEHSYVPPRATANSLGSVSRGIFITNKSLKPTNYDEITFLTVPPPDADSNPVRVIELNWAACACPKDLFLVHFTCKGVNTASEDLRYAVQQLFQPLTQEDEDFDSDKPKVLWSLFFNQVDASECDDAVLAEGVANNAMVTAGPGTSVGFEHAVSQARRLFERICPGEEFLPPAPDPEDIIYENPARDNPGEHHEVGFETPSSDSQAQPSEDSNTKDTDDSQAPLSDDKTKDINDTQAPSSTDNQTKETDNSPNQPSDDGQNAQDNSESQSEISQDMPSTDTKDSKDDSIPSPVSLPSDKEVEQTSEQ